MAMDLPFTRIPQGIFTQHDDGSVSIIDCVWKQELIGLHNDVALGDVVLMVHVKHGDRHVRKLMRITSDYEYETLNRRMIKQTLRDTLQGHDILVLDIGLLYEHHHQWYVGDRPISIIPNGDTGEIEYVSEVH